MHESFCVILRRTLSRFACLPCLGLRMPFPLPVSFCAHRLLRTLPQNPVSYCVSPSETGRFRTLSHFAWSQANTTGSVNPVSFCVLSQRHIHDLPARPHVGLGGMFSARILFHFACSADFNFQSLKAAGPYDAERFRRKGETGRVAARLLGKSASKLTCKHVSLLAARAA